MSVEYITQDTFENFGRVHRVKITIGEKVFLSPAFHSTLLYPDPMENPRTKEMLSAWKVREVDPFIHGQEVKTANECGPKPARKFDFTI